MAEFEEFGKPVADQRTRTSAFDRETAESERNGKCFVCNYDLSSTTTGDGSLPTDEAKSGGYLSSLKVYWVLRQVLEVPLESLETYLRSGRNPGEWLKICAACDKEFVEEVWRIWREFGEILRRFRVARRRLVEAMKSSVETEMQNEAEANGNNQFIRDIFDETRKFVLDYQYPRLPAENSFEASDLLAETLLKTKKLKQDEYLPVIEDSQDDTKTSNDEQGIKEELPEISVISDEDFVNFQYQDGDESSETEHPEKSDNERGSDSDWDPDKVLEEDEDNTTVKKPTFVRRSKRQVPRKKRCLKRSKPREQRKCDQTDCDEIFESIEQLRKHQGNVHKMKVLECPHCGWTTHLSDSLNQHLQRFHGTEEDLRQFTCTICDKQFAFKTTLANHNLRHHSDTPPEMFTCEHCGNQIASKSSYCRHLATVHGVKDYWRFPCDEPGCDKAFFTNSQLNRHKLVRHSSGESQFKCHICGVKIRARQNLKRHMEQHSNPTLFQCDQCPLSFTRKQYLKQHVDKNHLVKSSLDKVISSNIGVKEILKCQECDWHFNQAWRYQRHMKRLHGLQVEIPVKKKILPVSRKKNPLKKMVHGPVKSALPKMERQQYKCDQKDCDRIFNFVEKLKRHQAYTHKLKVLECPHCDWKTHRTVYLNQHLQRQHGTAEDLQQFICTICNKQFAFKESLTRHNLNFHSGTSAEKPKVPKQSKSKQTNEGTKSICSICGTILASKDSLRLHIKYLHQKKLECCCDICGKILRSRFYLARHKNSVHKIGDKVRPKFPCTVDGCEKTFTSPSRMRLHVLAIHEGNPQFQCDHCGKKLATNGHLQKHIQAMHTNRESKPFNCTVCGQGFAVKGYLWGHMKTHQRKAVIAK